MASGDLTPRWLDSSLFQQIGDRATSLDERIVAEIRSLIDSGRIAPGDRLPTERGELLTLMTEATANRDRLATDAAFARELDERYHNLVASLSHNRVLMRIMVGLLDLLAEVRQRSFAVPGRALHSMEEHQRITAAIVAGDTATARRTMLTYLRNAETAVRGTSRDT